LKEEVIAMPGFLISQSTLTKLPTTRSGDIPVEYTMSVMAPAGMIFAATPQALCELLKKSGMQSFHSGKFAVKGQLPDDVATDLNTRARLIFAPAVHASNAPSPVSAQAFTGGTTTFGQTSQPPLMAHELSHIVQQKNR
jgi:Domain of unknown function (DUF4157)